MRLKKMTAVILSGLMLLPLTACGSASQTGSEDVYKRQVMQTKGKKKIIDNAGALQKKYAWKSEKQKKKPAAACPRCV